VFIAGAVPTLILRLCSPFELPSSIKKTENNESTLSPQFIVNEKDIALNLPESTSRRICTKCIG
jgi:hypothetical protein